MKFQISLSRHQSKVTEVFAQNRDAAIALAEHDGFRADEVMQIGDEDEAVAEHVIVSRCEACGDVIWEGEEYGHSEDGEICHRCMTPNAI